MCISREQYNILKEYKKSIYKDYPQVEKYENRKCALIIYLFILVTLLIALHIYDIYSALGFHVIMIFVFLIRIDWIFILAALAPKWQVSLILYLLFFINVSGFLTFVTNTLETLIRLTNVKITSFAEFLQFLSTLYISPLTVVTIIYLISILIVAIWLTLVPRNRELSKQSEELIAKIRKLATQKQA